MGLVECELTHFVETFVKNPLFDIPHIILHILKIKPVTIQI
jgi:hypothetical protein